MLLRLQVKDVKAVLVVEPDEDSAGMKVDLYTDKEVNDTVLNKLKSCMPPLLTDLPFDAKVTSTEELEALALNSEGA